MTFEELQLEELNHIISDLKQRLNYELRKNRMLDKQLNALVALGDKISHQNEEQQETINDLEKELRYRKNEIREMQYTIDSLDKLSHEVEEKDETINELQNELKCRTNENKALYTDSRHLNKELEKATKEIKLLNNQIDNLQRNVGYLCEENIKLRNTINAYESLF